MPRINVFVPEALFERMQAARARAGDRRSGPNWSEIACAAFEATLQQIKEVRPTMSAAVRLPYPTAGDYSLFEVRRGRHLFKVKVSGSVCDAPNYVHRRKIPRIVAAFASEFFDENPDANVSDGDVLPVTLTAGAADAIAARL